MYSYSTTHQVVERSVDAEGADAGGGEEDLHSLALQAGHVQEGGTVLLVT